MRDLLNAIIEVKEIIDNDVRVEFPPDTWDKLNDLDKQIENATKWKKTSEHQIPDNTPVKFKMIGIDGEMIGIKKPDYNSITCLNQKGNYDMIRLVSITEFIEI